MKKLSFISVVLVCFSMPVLADETVVKEHHDNDSPGVALKVPAPDVV